MHMKYISCFLFFLATCLPCIPCHADDTAAASKTEENISQTTVLPNADSEKKLTPEEQYKIQQRKMDMAAIENAKNIRTQLRDIMIEIYDFSPSTAKFLAQKYFGIRVVQYIASLLILLTTLIVVKYLMSFFFSRISNLSRRDGKNSFASDFILSIQRPVNMFAWVIGIYFALAFLIKDAMTVAIVSRAVGVLFWCAVFWAILIVSDALFSAAGKRLQRKSANTTANLVEFLRRVTKCFITVIAILSILTNCGVNVNTIIASLGIGGMALAFASQDTIANFFGSVSIIIDRPFIVGDWVKTAQCEGHIETIGFRSTRIRTFSKTIVTIPNSILAKDSVENFSKMPVRKVLQTIGITYSTTADQIEKLLPEICKTISEIEGVAFGHGVSAEFTEFSASSLDISIVYYTRQIDYNNFVATKCRVNLAIMRLIAAHNLSFAFPSTSIYIESDATKKS